MSNIRKVHILELITKLVLDNDDMTVLELFRATLRSKNFSNSTNIFNLEATDAEFAKALEATIKDLKND